LKKISAGLLLALLASLFVVTPANAVTQICWSWSMQGVITGTFTTNAPSGGMTGANIASGSYTASDVAVLTSNIPSSATQAPVGSISDGTYYFTQVNMGFVWDGSTVTEFNRFNRVYTNGSNVYQTGPNNGLLFAINLSRFSSFYSSSNTATLTPLNDGVCTSGGGGGGAPSGNAEANPWVGLQAINCPNPNPWDKERIELANRVSPIFEPVENLIGKTISQSSVEKLSNSGVFIDNFSKRVSTATEILPSYGCKDKLVQGKVNQPIQFVVGGYTLQSSAHGFIKTPDTNWHDFSGVTLYTNTAAFMKTVKFAQPGKHVVVITEQPDLGAGSIPVYGIRSVRFVVAVS
jgi:hypothetical protein